MDVRPVPETGFRRHEPSPVPRAFHRRLHIAHRDRPGYPVPGSRHRRLTPGPKAPVLQGGACRLASGRQARRHRLRGDGIRRLRPADGRPPSLGHQAFGLGRRRVFADLPSPGLPLRLGRGVFAFQAPCHASVFTIDGRVVSGPAPRPLDTLPAQVRQGILYVEWEQFEVGILRRGRSRRRK